MKRFLVKFLIFFALLFGSVTYYYFFFNKECSGDIGNLGQIPFGNEYEGLNVSSYERTGIDKARVAQVQNRDSLCMYGVITIGDSFSQMAEMGYQWKLSSLLHKDIANFRHEEFSPFRVAIQLINDKRIVRGQMLIVESVERSLVQRLLSIDTTETCKEAGLKVSEEKETILNRYFSWIRLSCGYDNTISSFKLSQNCFIHDRYSSTLHVYNADNDGDLRFNEIAEEQFVDAANKAIEFIAYAESKGVHTVILVATDKYDAYEPMIKEKHIINPTMSYFHNIDGLYDSKDDIRNAIKGGTLEVYKCNNTHWSVVGADIVAEKVYDFITKSTTKSVP